MEKTRRKQAYPVKVKERVDYIYGLTTEREDGYHGGFTSDDTLTKDVVRELVMRGIVSKVQDMNKERRCFIYKWEVAMAPTKALYGSVVTALREHSRETKRNSVKRAKEKAVEEARALAEEAPIEEAKPEPVVARERTEAEKPINPLEKFTAKELWDEIKSRGYIIENNTIIRKEILE